MLSVARVSGAARSGLAQLAGGRLAAAALSWLWLVVAARRLPLAEFSDLAVLLALGTVFSVLADLGLPLVLMEAVAERPASAASAVAQVLRRRLAAALGASALVAGAYQLSASRPSLAVPAVFAVSILATAAYTSVTAALRSLGPPRAEAANEVASRLGVLFLGTWWLGRGGGLLAAVAVYALADLASAVALGAVARRRLPAGDPADPARFGWRATGPLGVAGILGTLLARGDLWLLAVLAGPTATALYAAASRLVEGLLLPAGALSALMVPRTAGLDPGARRAVVARVLRAGAPAAALAGLAAAATAPALLGASFGDGFGPAAGALRVLLVGLVPATAVLVRAPLAALADRTGFARATGGALALNLAANLVLVPRLGAAGAAWAAVASQVALAAAFGRLLRSTPVPVSPNRAGPPGL